MSRQAFVQKCVAGRQQFVDVSILKQHARNEGFDLHPEIPAQLVVKRREQQGVGLHRVQIVHVQPLERKIAHEAGGAGVGQHPPRLRFENFGALQFAGSGNLEQGVIGPLTPQKE